MTDQGPSPAVKADSQAKLPNLPLHPRMFLIAYWLMFVIGIFTGVRRAPINLIGLFLSAGAVVLLVTWTWQVFEYTGRCQRTGSGARNSRIGAALALLSVVLYAVSIILQYVLRVVALPRHLDQSLADGFSALGGLALIGLMVTTARRLIAAERASELKSSDGILTFFQLAFAPFTAGYFYRRLMKLAATNT